MIDVRLTIGSVDDTFSIELEGALRVHHHCHWALFQSLLQLTRRRLPKAIEVLSFYSLDLRRLVH
jgi:hypothetical protein